MLIPGRKSGESINLEIPNLDPIKITMFENDKTGIDAADEVQIVREELTD
jgi:sRNA-binding carbon storage regulator CsrA